MTFNISDIRNMDPVKDMDWFLEFVDKKGVQYAAGMYVSQFKFNSNGGILNSLILNSLTVTFYANQHLLDLFVKDLTVRLCHTASNKALSYTVIGLPIPTCLPQVDYSSEVQTAFSTLLFEIREGEVITKLNDSTREALTEQHKDKPTNPPKTR